MALSDMDITFRTEKTQPPASMTRVSARAVVEIAGERQEVWTEAWLPWDATAEDIATTKAAMIAALPNSGKRSKRSGC